jgi:sulfide:quinone oxidoreductase
MSIPVHWVSKALAVTGQIYPEDLTAVAAMGFKSVVCNRPDNEAEPGQPTAADIEVAAREHGLSFAWLPVAPHGGDAQNADDMGRLLTSLPQPILSYCKTGGRCVALISNAAAQGHAIPQ